MLRGAEVSTSLGHHTEQHLHGGTVTVCRYWLLVASVATCGGREQHSIKIISPPLHRAGLGWAGLGWAANSLTHSAALGITQTYQQDTETHATNILIDNRYIVNLNRCIYTSSVIFTTHR